MARGGINKAMVQKARTALLARGEHPSIDALRVELGNTGSKTTIHRYLKELEAADSGRGTAPLALSEQLVNLVNQLADQLQEEAQAAVAGERELLGRERIDYQQRTRQAESRIQQLEGQAALNAERLQAAHHELQQLREQRQQVEVENARLQQANRDLDERLKDRDAQIHSLEEKHRHARDTLEHYRQASKEQREQEQRRHESQVQQLQLEVRQLQQTLIVKQDELTQLNRDNARLLTEARQLHRDQQAQQRLLDQKAQVLEALQSQFSASEAVKLVLEQRNQNLQSELDSLSKAKVRQEPPRQSRRAQRATAAVDKSTPPAKKQS
ncbi:MULTISPECIES: DNA-binding protein [Pseudomonadaceae]|uniref:Cointegrate resolution protein T n=1 Tax=Pseudomonas kuykendallii TaxID=1007099 RepID=A0A2W5CT75_9PSED|nr:MULTISPECIES: DNA-binding protein [Pseudomonas]MDG9818728.1 DNA-binding protein [Pseudomonas aeruginosa]MDG9933506.1 DNA-binding protein [Pseudomonas aeruginosa]MDH0526767.1 DNA-binding protein [Pseudomonas aeruginosa]MDH0532546.1 DNA-binding protein [Pseudomonas aeruginosa]PKQ43217.1 cointegrate resolution protein T [Pseudomonas sp. YY-1]